MAPFGKFPYGREQYGVLQYEKSSGCASFKLQKIQKQEFPPMVMMDISDCSPKLMAYNAEKAGAKLLVLIGKKNSPDNEVFSKTHAMMEIVVEIPTISINYETGEKLKDLINHQGNPTLKFQMPIPQTNIVNVEFFIRLEDDKMFAFLKNVNHHIIQFENKITSNFRFSKPLDNSNLKEIGKIELMANCIPFQEAFEFLPTFYEDCIQNGKYTSDCFNSLIQSLDKSSINSYDSCYKGFENSVEQKFEEMKNRKADIVSHIMINQMTYHGSLKPENVFEAICGAFLESPEACVFLNNKYSVFLGYREIQKKSQNSKYFLYLINFFILIILLIIASIALYVVYNKIYDRVLRENVEVIVKDHISTYHNLKTNE